MPRLGSRAASRTPSPLSSRKRRGNVFRRIPRVNIRNVCLLFLALFIFRNLFRNDYRQEEMNYLRSAGISEEEIEKLIPKTREDRLNYVADKANDSNRMKRDIAYLLQQVQELKAGKQGAAGKQRESDFKQIDEFHERKRKEREDNLIKEHPDFKPSHRLKDDAEAKATE